MRAFRVFLVVLAVASGSLPFGSALAGARRGAHVDEFGPGDFAEHAPRMRLQSLSCDADPNAKRVQLLYVRGSSRPDGYAGALPQIRQWAQVIDDAFSASAAESGGSRHVRYVMDGSCNVDVPNVVLTDSQVSSFGSLTSALGALGYNRADRKYAAFVDVTGGCRGVATIWPDETPGPSNLNNTREGYARTDFPGCSFSSTAAAFVMAHEIMHTLGAVQNGAPHSTSQFSGAGGHCWDEGDIMCYKDASSTVIRQVCADHENRFDCNHDDYFHAGVPPASSYLATHWNTANSAWLISSTPSPPPPPPAGGPDYAGTWTSGPGRSCSAKRCTLTGTLQVFNRGTVSTPKKGSVRYLLSNDAVADAADTVVKSASVSSIAPGSSRSLALSLKLPASSGAGRYVIAVLDPTGAVAESDESNNVVPGGPLA